MSPRASEPSADELRERDELRRVMPLPDEDVAEELADALARSRFMREQFGRDAPVKLDRYELRRELGRGGMGVVFEAHDPFLKIPIALKLLQRTGKVGSEADHPQQREAQALAVVKGDHVVRVYTAGIYQQQLWLAMEFVEGPNLAAWLRDERAKGPVDWREVLPKFIDAARGLQSVHLAGLIHRDFKPHNAVVDPSGRVRVLDFGLATADRRPVAPAAAPGDHLRRSGLTGTGELVGTIRYASPEQFSGSDLDHRSDQFSLCVALFEALWARLPFGEDVPTGKLLADDPSARVPRPTDSAVPGWLTTAVLRGLAARPEQRFADMAALIEELTRDHRPPRRIGTYIFGGVVCGALAVWLTSRTPEQSEDRFKTCLAGQVQIDELSGDGEKFSRHIAAWRDAYTTACHQTYAQGESEALLEGRLWCLRRDLKLLTALVGPELDPSQEQLIGEMLPPSACLDAVEVKMPTDAVSRSQIEASDTLLAEADGMRQRGDYEGAIRSARYGLGGAQASEFNPAIARAQFTVGRLERIRGRGETAETALSAVTISEDPWLTIDAHHELADLALLGERAADNAAYYLKSATAMLESLRRHGKEDVAWFRTRWARHADIEGQIAYAAGRNTDAVARHEEALNRWRTLTDVMDVRCKIAGVLQNRGRAYSELGKSDEAVADIRESIALMQACRGEDHPKLGEIHYLLGVIHIERGEHGAAEVEGQRALAIDRAAGALTRLADDYQLLMKAAFDSGDRKRAFGYAKAAVDAFADIPEASPEQRADVIFNSAFAASEAGEPIAESLYEQAAEAYGRVPGPRAACQAASARLAHGSLIAAKLPDRAARLVDEAEDALQHIGESQCPAVAEVKSLRGQIAIARGDHAAALQFFEAALAATPEGDANRPDIIENIKEAKTSLRKNPRP